MKLFLLLYIFFIINQIVFKKIYVKIILSNLGDIKMSTSPCIYIIQAFAGHGKDYTREILEEIIKKETKKIHFAKNAKEMIASSLKKKLVKNLTTNNEKLDKLNHLKDDCLDIKVLGDKNAREMMQLILGDVIRTLNPEIHALFALKEMEKELLKSSPRIMICTDNRYKNEQELVYPVNLLESKEDKIDYIRWRIQKHKTNYSNIEVLELFDSLTKSSIKDKSDADMLNKIKMKLVNEIEILNNTSKPDNDFTDFIESIDFNKIDNYSTAEGLEKGLINVFRPLLPEDFKGQNYEDIIKTYNKINNEDLDKIKFYYEKSNVDFNIENIKKFGYLRADPNHSSECDLNGRKPEALRNIPMWEKNNINKLLKTIFKESQKKNIIQVYNNVKP
jgi:hypothetical protein